MTGKRTHQQVIADHIKPDAEQRPTFLFITFWMGLHLDSYDESINPEDLIQDYGFHSDGQRLYGFDKTEKGIAAFKSLMGITPGTAFIHDGNGSYICADYEFLDELGLEMTGGVDLSSEEAIESFIGNFFKTHDSQGNKIIPRNDSPTP